jgi:hypothetical protein
MIAYQVIEMDAVTKLTQRSLLDGSTGRHGDELRAN